MAVYETKHQSTGKRGERIGLLLGIIIAIFLINGAVNAFGDGAILWGLGFIIAAVAGFLYSIHLGMNFIVGECPFCGHTVQTFKNNLSTRCKACRKRIVVKHDRFIGVL